MNFYAARQPILDKSKKLLCGGCNIRSLTKKTTPRDIEKTMLVWVADNWDGEILRVDSVDAVIKTVTSNITLKNKV